MSLFDIEGVSRSMATRRQVWLGLLDAVIDISQDRARTRQERRRIATAWSSTRPDTDLIGLPAMSGVFEEGRVPFDVPASSSGCSMTTRPAIPSM